MEAFPKHKANFTFRGEKSDIWEGGHHVPLLMRWPGVITANKSSNALISLADFMATFAGLTKQDLPQGAGPDSYNYWPRIAEGKKKGRNNLIHHSNEGMYSIRKGKWKFIDGIGSGGWSPKDPADMAPGQLYNMEADGSETTNLYNQHPEIVKELKDLLEQQKRRGHSVSGKNHRQN